MSKTKNNIRIPNPTEGVIRTAQLDDSIAPENSVQLAVNLDFDRIGAMKTRMGVEQFANNLTGKIKNFGGLNNFTIPDGYENLTRIEVTDEFTSDEADYIAVERYSNEYAIAVWEGVDGDGFAQIFKIDTATGRKSYGGPVLEFDTSDAEYMSLKKIDSTHFLCVYSGAALAGKAVVLAVNPANLNISLANVAFTFDVNDAKHISVSQINSNHFVVFYASTGSVGKAITLEINLSTWAISAPSSSLTFDAIQANHNSCESVGDGVHFINFWASGSTGKTQVFSINPSTWSITANASPLTFDNINGHNGCSSLGDGERFINFWTGDGQDGFARVFKVNLSTFAVSVEGELLEFDTNSALYNRSISLGDGKHFVNSWRDNRGTGYIQSFEVNQLTYNIYKQQLPIYLGDNNGHSGLVLLTPYKLVSFWASANVGVCNVFNLEGAPVYNNILFAQQENGDVYAKIGANWVLKRKNLSITKKARFDQFLNYLWMVNGNGFEGEEIATSNGDTFGRDLVPTAFPGGDFIQAGFEGRVWVADASLDIIYYTDIVQFTPPATYSLSFNPNINFLRNFSSQDGQKMTALIDVPRALLVFKEDSIFRIYGASSVDAYPAYNVGTYSQESIVKTKDSIYFHHSSGFYKFDYGGQPIEISRRIIDFVKAIPRSSYENITGIWDGFDSVKWYVGSVTVDGVTYSNCVVRYSISTQVWTIYDYKNNEITALIRFDDGTNIHQIAGTNTGVVAKLDSGKTDLTKPIYYEMIDRQRSWGETEANVQSITSMFISSENGGGAQLQYQIQKDMPNEWRDIGKLDENEVTLLPNIDTEDFNEIRFRLKGYTTGEPIVFKSIGILSLIDKGLNQN